jgi:alkylation response protein AidB-like acyl-CoA dehydrogenase
VIDFSLFEKLMRDEKLLQICEGTNQIGRMVIARQISK